MHARNARTGSRIKGTLERLSGHAGTVENGLSRSADGQLTHKLTGYSHVYWNDEQTVRRGGETVYVDGDGEGLTSAGIECVDKPEQELQPFDGNKSNEPPDLNADGRTTSFDKVRALYELIDRKTGAGQGPFTSVEDAEAEKKHGEIVAAAVYTVTDQISYVDNHSEGSEQTARNA